MDLFPYLLRSQAFQLGLQIDQLDFYNPTLNHPIILHLSPKTFKHQPQHLFPLPPIKLKRSH